MRSWLRRVRRFFQVSQRDRWRLLLAQYRLLEARVLIWLRPSGRLLAAQPAAGPAHTRGRRADLPAGVVDLETAVMRAARHGVFHPTCLTRALALHRLLDGAGHRGSIIRVGVRRQSGHFQAHAWVELEGVVLGDEADHVGGFVELSDARMLPKQ